MTEVYIAGRKRSEDDSVCLSLTSSAIVFVIKYCRSVPVKLIFVHKGSDYDRCVAVQSLDSLGDVKHEFASEASLPAVITNCSLPVAYDSQEAIVRSGLCCTVRHIIKLAHAAIPEDSYQDLLGFRQGSLRMCAEVSGWTKLCEVELSSSVSQLISEIRTTSNQTVNIPHDLGKLEAHLKTSPLVHNDNKLKRKILQCLKKSVQDPQQRESVLQCCHRNNNCLVLKKDEIFPHGIRRYMCKNQSDVTDVRTDKVKCNGDVTDVRTDKVKCTDGVTDVRTDKVKCNGDVTDVRTDKVKCNGDVTDVRTDKVKCNGDVTDVRTDKVKCNDGVTDVRTDKVKCNGDVTDVRTDKVKCIGDVTDIHTDMVKCNGDVTAIENHVCKGDDGINVKSGVNQNKEDNSFDLVSAIMRLSFLDVEIVHLYSEGIEMTIADLILFVYFYHLMESVKFHLCIFKDYIPRILQWFSHLCSISRVQKTGESCGFSMDALLEGLDLQTSPPDQPFDLVMPLIPNTEHKDIELCRRNKSNFKAYKPDVKEVLEKIKDSPIEIQTGQHTRGLNVQLAWDQLPSGVHPREGCVPEKRVKRKCEQLENLVTAVIDIACDGDIIVDFCSGGGHLGIAIAHLLPSCKVYLIENKEESLMKARQRVGQLALSNVVLFQCNLEYFGGHFNIGVSLHACGVATDMVLQHCLDNRAAFVICPCCYGSMQKTHLITYPRSKLFIEAGITYKEFLTLGHAADQTEFNIKLENQGRYCSNLVDTDRAELAREKGYHVTLCTLHPPSCTPKNSLLIGTPQGKVIM